MKMTPGPWECVDHSWSDCGVYAGGKRIAGLTVRDDATEENQDELTAEMQANARAMAAVPDLIAALERVMLDITFMVESKLIPDVRDDIIYTRARDALAKARGEG